MTSKPKPGEAGETLEVRYGGLLVGLLRRRSEEIQDIEFVYDEAWTKDPNAFAVSTRMPLAKPVHEPDVVYRWFLNLLPEGRTLKTVGTILKIPEANVFALLEELGEDLPGALEVLRPADQRPKRTPRYRRLSEAERAAAIRRLPEKPLLVGEEGIHMSLAGAQDKLPVARYPDGGIGLALDGAPTTHILKPANKHFHSAVENEAFCLRLAAKVKLPVAECTIDKAEDLDYLLVRRYDRVPEGRSLRRLHQEDFCQATGHIPSTKYEANPATRLRGPSMKDCFDVIRKTDNGAANAARFLDFFVFNVLCGNVDAHSKNYSLLLLPGGAVTMAPLYDVMNGDIYPDVTRNLAMKIADKNRGRYIHARHWDHMAEENQISGTQVRRRVGELSQAVLDALPSVVDELNALKKSPVYQQISDCVAVNCRDMLRNLKSDVEDEPEEDPEPPGARPPGFS
ncbi:type II toxin-antitoxin system HipA family toxin [Bradyrhizobium japonicum]|uniref:type II toxin-antitoxin system HipA family toxin n=1 Tax=Bradyrhizobium japonicum TaxID=375 RepID=UPI000411E9EE|nr:type II toxin-antitoxin system HipA family toxin [Bradyrhizobium japonicum]